MYFKKSNSEFVTEDKESKKDEMREDNADQATDNHNPDSLSHLLSDSNNHVHNHDNCKTGLCWRSVIFYNPQWQG